MGVINGGTYFNVMYLTFDGKTKKIIKTVIEGPVPVCEKVFSKSLDCSYKNDSALETAGKLQKWRFHKKPVYAQGKLSEIFKRKWEPLMQTYFEKIAVTEMLCDRVRDK